MRTLSGISALAVLAAGAVLTAPPAAAEDTMAARAGSCAQLHADYPNGIAKTDKAARAAVRAGYRKPFVCKRVYLRLQPLDTNRNRSVCEIR